MKKTIFITGIICLAQLFSACEEWFDVNPKIQVKNDILFENESGFKTALYGIYTTMATSPLYGQQLTMSFLDVLAQYYTLGSSYHHYYTTVTYDYESSAVNSRADNLWQELYKTIMNCNNLLENMETRKALFTERNYELMRGEVLGIRAFLHFDLLRLFAPSFTVGKDQPAIPYVDRVARTPFPQLTNEQVTERVLQDCRAALELLAVSDPFGPAGEQAARDDEFLDNRRERMNYYAVKAFMARVHLWTGNTVEARSLTEELIATPGLGVSSPLFWLYSDKVENWSDEYFTENAEIDRALQLSQNQRKEFYETEKYSSSDSRISDWMLLNPNTIESDDNSNTGRYLITKYTRSSPYKEDLPLLRMAEVYYINAECQTSAEDALGQLNRVRREFGIPEAFDLTVENCVPEEELMKEYRKTFLAEGQFFFFMKRKDFQTIPGGNLTESPRTVFCLPMPENEKEFGNLINE